MMYEIITQWKARQKSNVSRARQNMKEPGRFKPKFTAGNKSKSTACPASSLGLNVPEKIKGHPPGFSNQSNLFPAGYNTEDLQLWMVLFRPNLLPHNMKQRDSPATSEDADA